MTVNAYKELWSETLTVEREGQEAEPVLVERWAAEVVADDDGTVLQATDPVYATEEEALEAGRLALSLLSCPGCGMYDGHRAGCHRV
jgi:hypothetical protein